MQEQLMTLPFTRDSIEQFARDWVASWNRQDVEGVLAHFADDVRFTSPRASAAVGSPTVAGKDALRTYWQTALAHIEAIHFTLDHAVWDSDRSELVILYVSEINGQRSRAAEWMRFDLTGRVAHGEALYGAAM
jgi:ketosteroid isomerase-like protein